MRGLAILSVSFVLAVVAPHGKAQVSTVRFDNVAAVPSGHLPMSGGYLHPDSQNFQEEGLHIEIFWVPNDSVTFVQGHFHHVENGYETSHGFESTAGLGPDRQGLYIRRADGGTFDLLGHDYQNVIGFATNMYIAGMFDPAIPGLGQFTPVPVGPGTLWQQATLSQFQDLDELFLYADLGTSATTHFRWDNIRTGVVSDLVVDSFEGPILNGGIGWSGESWDTTGQIGLGQVASRTVARIKDTGSIRRVASMVGVLNPRLSVDMMIANYEGLDTASLQVSGDGINFTTLRDFTVLDSDDQFYEYNFDLGFLSSAPFIEVALVTSTSGTPDYCFIDNLAIRGVDDGGALPVADPGADRRVEDPLLSGSVDVVLDGTASIDPDGTIVNYEWSEGQVLLGTTDVVTVNLPYGDHYVTLTITDNDGNVASADVSIYCSPGTLAFDGFESGDFAGGTGDWTGSWNVSGLVATGPAASRPGVVTRIRDTGSISRSVDLSLATHARLVLWYMVADYELGDTASIEVSSDGVNFTSIHTITSADSDRVWRFLDLDLSAFAMTSNFVIRVRTDTQATNARDYIHLDDVEVLGRRP